MPVAQHYIPYVAHAKAIHHDVAFGDLAIGTPPVGSELEHLPAFDDKDVLRWDAYLFGHAGMVNQVAILAVDGHKEPGAHQV